MYVQFIGDIFLNMLKCLIIPLLVSSIVSAIGSLDLSLSSKIGFRAIAYYVATTSLAVFQVRRLHQQLTRCTLILREKGRANSVWRVKQLVFVWNCVKSMTKESGLITNKSQFDVVVLNYYCYYFFHYTLPQNSGGFLCGWEFMHITKLNCHGWAYCAASWKLEWPLRP